MAFDIEQGVPLPNSSRGSGHRDALRKLAEAPVGSSVFFPGLERKTANALSQNASAIVGPGRLTMRSVDGGYRFWRKA